MLKNEDEFEDYSEKDEYRILFETRRKKLPIYNLA
ncbi:conserved hypothetical protein [Bacillus cereus Q1]|uniref:Uncharacterized protein n=1 Tax=Bacillus cereus (strain Q1) TaxID=361100 RepID=B9J482_BACCQ|nr:conserved hypothetical protein [Bacillus cereus Q1]